MKASTKPRTKALDEMTIEEFVARTMDVLGEISRNWQRTSPYLRLVDEGAADTPT